MCQNVNLSCKRAVQNAGCVIASLVEKNKAIFRYNFV